MTSIHKLWGDTNIQTRAGTEQDWEMGEIKLTLWEVLELAVVPKLGQDVSVFTSPLVSHWMCAAL